MKPELETLRRDIDDGVLTVTLHRPEHLNAFTVTMADEFEATFGEANETDEVRGIIVTGAGRAFCAGMDLAARATRSASTSPSRRAWPICGSSRRPACVVSGTPEAAWPWPSTDVASPWSRPSTARRWESERL